MGFAGPRKMVVIVGAGLGGTATAIRLLQFAREPLQVVVVERRPDYRSAGIAYHRSGNHWHHVFNIQAGRMSMFREDVDDFLVWANHEADRTGWPEEWRDATFVESGPAPRRIYADYLAVRLAEAVREASIGVTLREVDGEVVDLVASGDHVDVVLAERSSRISGAEEARTLRADHVVLATGLEERDLPFAADVGDHPAFVRHPYSEAGIERILGVRKDAEVAIVGTLLSAYDSASLLLRGGHTGKIHMISRSGLTLRTYPTGHRHRVLRLPEPELLADDYEGRDRLVRRLMDEWQRLCAMVAREYPGVDPAVVTEHVAKSWETALPAALARVPSSDLRALLDEHGSLLATLRVGAVPYITAFVAPALAEGGQVVLATGRVEEIADTGDGTLRLSLAGRDRTQVIEADLVISNFGRETDYERVGSPLWTSLLRKRIAMPHRRTGRGVEVDELGVLLDADGARSGPISVVGCPREGDEIVRHGRLGAFAFNLAAIKNHSVGVAATVLHRLEARFEPGFEPGFAPRADGPADIDPETWDPKARDEFENAVRLDVHRMATRRRRDRDVLAVRLEERLESLHRILAADGDDAISDRALRYTVNKVAMTRLSNLSVTPRDLRALLGLDEPPESR
ncbi:FAD/NAD(P)-binding protein [Actinomadura harenae]|uniref:Pyridine nucleotide-disulfide oxidoreductase n=1 Tax=Actinomadura harenae TaxID=2483351 RepID=A0A3M2M052_9ACTN|nr:FAD/NAD(P)-binding protein [Actinomadura harenae]RMI42947.1 pyridine nucleotide-disulfide oxidoreductase [Actinomadura harenae]